MLCLSSIDEVGSWDIEKLGNIKGTFHAEIGTIKYRNVMDLTEAEILRRGGKNTQNYTNKILMTQITTMV